LVSYRRKRQPLESWRQCALTQQEKMLLVVQQVVAVDCHPPISSDSRSNLRLSVRCARRAFDSEFWSRQSIGSAALKWLVKFVVPSLSFLHIRSATQTRRVTRNYS
jgi:hypothetical protein